MVTAEVRTFSHVAFTDESGVGERHLAYGGVFLPASNVAVCEDVLATFCADSGFAERELSWKKCSKGEVDRYRAFALKLWEMDSTIGSLDFRSLVIDTIRNPLRHPASGAATEEAGFYKFYHFFIRASVQIVAPDARGILLNVAVTADRYPYRTEILGKTVAGALKAQLSGDFEVAEVIRDSPKMNRLHQLADVLTGAVTYRLSGRDPGGTSHKRLICEAIEQQVGKRLDRDFLPSERPFKCLVLRGAGHRSLGEGRFGYCVLSQTPPEEASMSGYGSGATPSRTAAHADRGRLECEATKDPMR